MKDIHLNVFNFREDNQVKPLPTSWDNIISLFTSPHEVLENKSDSKLFNGVRYKTIDDIPEYTDDWVLDSRSGNYYVKRRQINIIENDLLILDYDGGVTLEEILKRFKEYEFIYYTSFRHLYDGETEKFRIIFPFLTPIPCWKKYNEHQICIDYGEWYQITESLKEFSGECDEASFNPNQIYQTPSVPKERVHLSQSGYNEGKLLDWSIFKRIPIQESEHNIFSNLKSDTSIKSNEYLSPDQVLQTKNGSIIVKEVTGLINGVVCPFHPDKNGSEFIRKVESTGNIFLHCNSCNRNYYMKKTHNTPEVLTLVKKSKSVGELDKKKIYTVDDLLEFPELGKVFQDGSDRSRVLLQLQEIKKVIDSDKGYQSSNKHPVNIDLKYRKYKSHILYLPEGSGKSHLVIDMVSEGQKVIFCCKSWEQIEEKYDEFKRIGIQRGFNVRIVRSKDAKSRNRFNTKVVREEQRYPYQSPRILDEETIDEFIKNNPDLSPEFIRLSWNFFSTDRMSFDSIPHPEISDSGHVYDDNFTPPISDNNTRIICTTFEQIRIHRLKNINIPKDWIIWFDDPDKTDVIDIDPYDSGRWDELSDEEFEEKIIEVNRKRYFRRNIHQSLGYSVRDYKTIYTTTEKITLQLIEKLIKQRKSEYVIHDEMENIFSGNITILGTSKVRKRFDGIIPLVVRRLTKMKYPTILIGDGLSSKFNHSNNKGRNDLSNINLLVELSYPHPSEVRTISDSLNLNYKQNSNSISQQVILDRLHQAIGRNSGYRWKGCECVILVEKGVHKKIVDETRYKIDKENSVIIDKTQQMSRKHRRITDTSSQMVQDIESILNNINDYIFDNRKVKPDITFVLDSIDDIKKKNNYIVRLIVSLIQLSEITVNKDFFTTKPSNGIQKKYWDLITWIFDTHIPKNQTGIVVTLFHKTIKEL